MDNFQTRRPEPGRSAYQLWNFGMTLHQSYPEDKSKPIQQETTQNSQVKTGRLESLGDEDMTCMRTAILGDWHGDEGGQQGFPSREGGPKLIRFESPSWRPKTTQVRIHFRVQEQHTLKITPRSHTESILNILYMHGKPRR